MSGVLDSENTTEHYNGTQSSYSRGSDTRTNSYVNVPAGHDYQYHDETSTNQMSGTLSDSGWGYSYDNTSKCYYDEHMIGNVNYPLGWVTVDSPYTSSGPVAFLTVSGNVQATATLRVTTESPPPSGGYGYTTNILENEYTTDRLNGETVNRYPSYNDYWADYSSAYGYLQNQQNTLDLGKFKYRIHFQTETNTLYKVVSTFMQLTESTKYDLVEYTQLIAGDGTVK